MPLCILQFSFWQILPECQDVGIDTGIGKPAMFSHSASTVTVTPTWHALAVSTTLPRHSLLETKFVVFGVITSWYEQHQYGILTGVIDNAEKFDINDNDTGDAI
jgi:hypothetical protein